jgi:hypothetical protein
MPANHWSQFRPLCEVVEAAFLEAIFIGLQLPSDGHAPRRTLGRPRARVDHDHMPASRRRGD